MNKLWGQQHSGCRLPQKSRGSGQMWGSEAYGNPRHCLPACPTTNGRCRCPIPRNIGDGNNFHCNSTHIFFIEFMVSCLPQIIILFWERAREEEIWRAHFWRIWGVYSRLLSIMINLSPFALGVCIGPTENQVVIVHTAGIRDGPG